MKHILLLIILATIGLMSGCSDKAVTLEQIPETINVFIKQTFPDQSIIHAERELSIAGYEYSIVLANGVKIEFDGHDEWDKVESSTLPVPDVLIPTAIASQVRAHYPGTPIIKIDKAEGDLCEVELAGGLDLKFDRQGRLVKTDD